MLYIKFTMNLLINGNEANYIVEPKNEWELKLNLLKNS